MSTKYYFPDEFNRITDIGDFGFISQLLRNDIVIIIIIKIFTSQYRRNACSLFTATLPIFAFFPRPSYVSLSWCANFGSFVRSVRFKNTSILFNFIICGNISGLSHCPSGKRVWYEVTGSIPSTFTIFKRIGFGTGSSHFRENNWVAWGNDNADHIILSCCHPQVGSRNLLEHMVSLEAITETFFNGISSFRILSSYVQI